MAKNLLIPYDKLWKSIVTEHFEDFLEMFLPELHQEVDYNVPFKFLEQEIKAALIDKTLKQMDKLVRVNLKNGEEKWVFVHVEFETSHKPITKERMYDYHSRIKKNTDEILQHWLFIQADKFLPIQVFTKKQLLVQRFPTSLTLILSTNKMKTN